MRKRNSYTNRQNVIHDHIYHSSHKSGTEIKTTSIHSRCGDNRLGIDKRKVPFIGFRNLAEPLLGDLHLQWIEKLNEIRIRDEARVRNRFLSAFEHSCIVLQE